MKKRFLSFCGVAALAIGFTACNSSGDTADTKDSSNSTTTNSTTVSTPTDNTNVSVGNYAAMADSVERNSQQGYYLNPKTGKAYKSLKVDRTTGAITDDAGEPVWRYVDNRNWWVWGDNGTDSGHNWGQVGEARMEKDRIMYKGDGDKWLDYDNRWLNEDAEMAKKWKSSDGGMKQKVVTEEGDKIKVKTDEEGNTKIKVNDQKTKVDKNGNEKKQ
ncbi:MAG TPA: hypothetical protein VM871_10195 [Flavisolibacter sp.]|nr:hypothetical protein [Flavisolibacter sp.]